MQSEQEGSRVLAATKNRKSQSIVRQTAGRYAVHKPGHSLKNKTEQTRVLISPISIPEGEDQS